MAEAGVGLSRVRIQAGIAAILLVWSRRLPKSADKDSATRANLSSSLSAGELSSGAKTKIMWMLLLSPILALLPKPWRDSMRFSRPFPWVPAATISGIVESLLALYALGYWYSVSVLTWADKALDAATRGNAAAQSMPGQAVGFAALSLWALHPLTGIIAYFAVEGAVRGVGALASGNILGTLPLYLVDWAYGRISGRTPPADAIPGLGPLTVISSIAQATHERARQALSTPVPDEVFRRSEEGEEFIEIQAQRNKADWVPPPVVRMGDTYHRLEKADRTEYPRPYRYTLRRLPAGVPGRNVLIYLPETPERSNDKEIEE